ncbi:glycosyltransferase [Acetobacteraceae bacterium]|nr:glycosyltransferase [Candidatus Parcubacteria bacterium]
MRIAICTDQYLPMISGLVDSVDILARQLQKNGHEVRVYAPSLPGSIADAKVFRFPAFALPGSGGSMIVSLPFGALRDMRNFKPDIIHTHLFGIAGLFAWYTARRLNVPLIGTDHTFPADYLHYMKLNFPPFPYLVRRFSAWYYNRCAFVTVPSEKLRKELIDHGFHRASVIISNHVPADVFRPLFKEQCKEYLGISGKTVLIFGRIAREKNLEVALEVFEEVIKRTQATLVFVGDGPHRTALENKIKEMGLESYVRFLGVLRGEKLVEAINCGDVFLMTSLSENQPMSMLQAMACGLPVVVANAGGPPEYVEEGKSGYIVEPNNTTAFAGRVLEILQNDEHAQALGEGGRVLSLQFSPESITAEFQEVYTKVLQNHVR